ncbi:hypothetical protein QFZ35_003566 [Arthrobacter ulcerisalmonis]|uniref:hypothetical protein n=1 Tax=Arthrobacter sp. B1I2 TaxID=3042263 RepID=UPI0027894705|nr:MULTISPECIES: hypothetical protein [Arthrobacter]MDQ0665068.1 hypothetical protein [Arthrobacter ulcerisalmonis]MDQ0732760.1 hypothetical protein [Arthrobacter sp. B1I2]
MSIEDGGTSHQQGAVPASVRAQLLATEHWGLLASRSTAQSEVLTRISMFLTFTSASLVSVALVGQATGFSDAFVLLAVAVLFIDAAIGLLTQLRVMNVAYEDLMYVTAMNRLRAAYVDLDPGVAPYLMAAHHDDQAGSRQTYYFFGNESNFGHVAGSSMIFMTTANAALIAILTGLLVTLAGAGTAGGTAAGAVCGAGFLALSVARGGWRYHDLWRRYTPLSPTPPPDGD